MHPPCPHSLRASRKDIRVNSVCTCVVEAFWTSSASTKAPSIVRPRSWSNLVRARARARARVRARAGARVYVRVGLG